MSDTLRIAVRRFDPFERAIQRQYVHFQAATGCPLRLAIESLDVAPLYHSLFTQRGLTDGAWDAALVVTDWIAEAVATGAVIDLVPLMDKAPIPDYPHGWSPALTRFQRFGEAVYGVPYHDGPECVIYRLDLFNDPNERRAFAERHGYPLQAPRTWEQFEDAARFFTRPEEGLYGTIFAAFPDGHNAVYDFCLQLWSRGGDLTDAGGAVTLDTAPAAAALDFYRRMVKDRTVTPPGQEGIDSVESGEIFASGAVAMMVNWFGFAAVCEQPACSVRGRVDVAPLPTGVGGSETSLNVYWLLCIGAGSRHREEAYSFLRHVCSAEMDKLTTLEGGIGCRLSTWNDPEVNDAVPFYHRLEALHAFSRELPRSRELPTLVRVIDEAVQRAIRGDDPTEAILRLAQAEAATIRL